MGTRVPVVVAAFVTALVAASACTSELTPTLGGTPGGVVRLLDPGNGSDGTLVVTAGTDVPPNFCQVLATSSSDGLTLEIAGGFVAGDRVLAWQVQDSFATSGTAQEVSLASTRAGNWEVFEVVAVEGRRLRVHAPAYYSYVTNSAGARAQACLIPQYASVTVQTGGTLQALDWSESAGTGGVLALFVSGTLLVEGDAMARGAGFEGGIGIDGGPVYNSITAFETVGTSMAGAKGGGVDGTARARYGRGNFANGGGGGGAYNAGGGGGGSAGAGGAGGMQSPTFGENLGTRGAGGAAVAEGPLDRLVLGGGGGAGHQDNNAIENGADGGGVILLFVESIAGSGQITADGVDGDPTSTVSDDGGPGGGGGGVVLLYANTISFGGTITARGGRGGDVGEDDVTGLPRRGPGGGGGGGWIIAPAAAVNAVVDGGPNGVNKPVSNDGRNAQSGAPGTIVSTD